MQDKRARKLPLEEKLHALTLHQRVKCRGRLYRAAVAHAESVTSLDPQRVASLQGKASAWPAWQNDTDMERQNAGHSRGLPSRVWSPRAHKGMRWQQLLITHGRNSLRQGQIHGHVHRAQHWSPAPDLALKFTSS